MNNATRYGIKRDKIELPHFLPHYSEPLQLPPQMLVDHPRSTIHEGNYWETDARTTGDYDCVALCPRHRFDVVPSSQGSNSKVDVRDLLR